MKTAVVSVCATAALLNSAVAWPGMSKTLGEIHSRQTKTSGDSIELIGDIRAGNQLSPVGKQVKAILLNQASAESNEMYSAGTLAQKGTPQCAADTCCIWQYISNDMAKAFRGSSGRCTESARNAIRLGFHDAAGWSKSTGDGGGADGSIILAPEEMMRSDNNGLEAFVETMKGWYTTYKRFGVSMADLIQMGANVATVTCPLGPRTRSYVGRKDSSVASTPGLLPGVDQSADELIALFQDKTINYNGLIALIGAHSTSQQTVVNVSRIDDPQDSTPGVWDTKFYQETLDPKAPKRVFKFQSDVVLSRDPRTAPRFEAFAAKGAGQAQAQSRWNADYAREYVRLSLLGVHNINMLTDCTKVLPPRITANAGGGQFEAKDQNVVDQWLQSVNGNAIVGTFLKQGQDVKGLINSISKTFSKVISNWQS